MLFWLLAAFFSGSLMFSYWLGLLAERDVRQVGDGNPGAINLWKAAGAKLGVLGVVLDFSKGYVPVLAAMSAGHRDGHELALIAAAPVFGHIFSPFLKFRGGKGIAVTFGVWSALTAFEVTLVYAVILAVLLVVGRALNGWRPVSSEADSFQVVIGMFAVSVWLHQRSYPAAIFWGWCANIALMIWAHRTGLRVFLKKWI